MTRAPAGAPSDAQLRDGPAASYPDGRRSWFVNGVTVREERVAT